MIRLTQIFLFLVLCVQFSLDARVGRLFKVSVLSAKNNFSSFVRFRTLYAKKYVRNNVVKSKGIKYASSAFFRRFIIKNQNNNRLNWLNIKKLCGPFLLVAPCIKSNSKAKNESANKATVYKSPFEYQRMKFYADLLNKPWAKVCQKYLNALHAKEKKLMDEVLILTGITQKELEKFKVEKYQQYLQIVKDRNKTRQNESSACIIPKYVTNAIVHAIKYFGIHPNQIDIIADKESSSVSVSQSTFQVGDFFFENCSEKVKNIGNKEQLIKDAVMHEMMHILHDDSYLLEVLKNIVPKNPENNEAYQQLQLKFAQFHEERADTLACLIDPKIAQSFAHFFSNVAVPTQNTDFSTEPEMEPKKRGIFFQKIYDEIQSEN